ncbi:RidA family protein [Brevibacterium litoralis]|uniref:RidA family protein n=1 Tax=Brevibacterium litoralis TaxID=3138935 RepID=UPI0032EEF75E
MTAVEQKLESLGLPVPAVVPPKGAYSPAVRSGEYVYTSGQLPVVDGELLATGKLGGEVSLEQGYEAAKIAALNALAAVKDVVGDLDRIAQVVKVVGYVASTPDFTKQPLVINGASEFLGEVLGEKGQHARSAVGMSVLPLDTPVEVEMIVRITED